jgi:phenylacetate-CoA ligase
VSDANAVGAENRRRFVLDLRDKFIEMSRMPPEILDEVLHAELKQIASFAKIRIPWYTNEFPASNEISSSTSLTQLLSMLPILKRKDVQDNFDGMYFKSPEHDESDYAIQATSGSTSKPVSVMKFAPLYSAEYDALTLTEWYLQKHDVTKSIASFRLTNEENDNVPIGPPLSYIGANRRTTARSILHNSIEQLLEELHRLKPDYLFVNGVVLRQLALTQMQSDLPRISVENILTVSDRIDPELRELVNEVFESRIIDSYSSEEFGYIALQCPKHNHLHVWAPSVVIEIVDEFGNPCPVGIPGRVLVTSLHNFAMPLIRYEIGDIAQFGAACESGLAWPVIERIVGRTRAAVTLSNGDFHLVTFFECEFMKMRNITDFQVVLFDDVIAFIYHANSPLEVHELEIIETELESAFRCEVPVVFREVPNDHWQKLWKRSEWDRIELPYNNKLSDSELLLLLNSLDSR